MRETIYIVTTKHNVDRMTKNPPNAVRAGEYVVRLVIEVPEEVFRKPPVPVVEVVLPAAQVGTADVRVDGETMPQSVDEASAKQVAVQHQLAELMQSMRQSPDPRMREQSDVTLLSLIEAGVDVRLVDASLATEQAGEAEGDNAH